MANRKELISQIESARDSRLICYCTGDRQQLAAQIGEDVLPLFPQHLTQIGKVPKLDLLIYSRGGNTLSGFAISNALREFADHVAVLVPFRAHSCATLIALGANEIVMGPFGQLSPIDPSITTPHGPTIERQGNLEFLSVSVEDVANYIELARKEVGLKSEEYLASVFGHLCDRVSPLALGTVYRAREQIGMLATKLLRLHIDNDDRIDRIVKQLSRELLSHDYYIGRREAKGIGLPVADAPPDLSEVMWKLFEDISEEMRLGEPWNLEKELGQAQNLKRVTTRAILESRDAKHAFQTTFALKRVNITKDGTKTAAIQSAPIDEGWKRL